MSENVWVSTSIEYVVRVDDFSTFSLSVLCTKSEGETDSCESKVNKQDFLQVFQGSGIGKII